MRVRLVLSARPDSRIQPLHRAGDCVGAILLDRLGHYEPAATVAGFALSPLTAASFPKIKLAIAHLRNILGEQTYEALARKGETTTTASMVSYDYDQSTRLEQN
jgi:hypothetical protein